MRFAFRARSAMSATFPMRSPAFCGCCGRVESARCTGVPRSALDEALEGASLDRACCSESMAHRADAWVAAQRCLSSRSTLVGAPRRRFSGGGEAGRWESIQARTSCSYQHRRRLCGSLNGRGTRCLYCSFDKNVRMVFGLLPIRIDSCSMKTVRTAGAAATCWPDLATAVEEVGMTHIHPADR